MDLYLFYRRGLEKAEFYMLVKYKLVEIAVWLPAITEQAGLL